MENVRSVSVKHLIQWSNLATGKCLKVNDAYPRVETPWTIFEKGKYIYNIMCGLDLSIITINSTTDACYIVDGARRISLLSEFQQGKLAMVIQYGKMPDRVKFRLYGVSPREQELPTLPYEAYTLVEVTFNDLQVDQQRAFLQANVDICSYLNITTEVEKQLYWQANYICPPSPTFSSEYDESELYKKVCDLLTASEQAALVQTMHLVGGVHRKMACSELLELVHYFILKQRGVMTARLRTAATENPE